MVYSVWLILDVALRTWYIISSLLFFFFPIPFIVFALLFLSLLVVTQIRGHIAGSSTPLPTTVRALHCYREKISPLSSLVGMRICHVPGQL